MATNKSGRHHTARSGHHPGAVEQHWRRLGLVADAAIQEQWFHNAEHYADDEYGCDLHWVYLSLHPNDYQVFQRNCGCDQWAIGDWGCGGHRRYRGIGTGSGGAGTYTVSISQSVKSGTAINATTTSLGSTQFQTLSQQPGISQGTAPKSPLNPINTVMDLFFVNTLNPPASGTLYGFSWICNNGAVIGSNTFFAPSPLNARPDTIAHELLHNLCLDHTTYGAGPWARPRTRTGPRNILNPSTTPLSASCRQFPQLSLGSLISSLDSAIQPIRHAAQT